MPKRSRKKPEPKETNQRTRRVVNLADSDTTSEEALAKSAAALLGRLGGLKGGKARAERLTSSQRSRIARKAARARWKKDE
jgi:hypothetical protein